MLEFGKSRNTTDCHFISLFTTFVADQARSPQRRLFPDATRLNLGDLEPVEVARLIGAVLGRKAPPPVSCFEFMKRREGCLGMSWNCALDGQTRID